MCRYWVPPEDDDEQGKDDEEHEDEEEEEEYHVVVYFWQVMIKWKSLKNIFKCVLLFSIRVVIRAIWVG